ncbi:MAG: type II secretion system protein [Candidatus Microsaccharimonas sp.]
MTQKVSRIAARGFTIVELIIVIVVIAILATVTIVSYNAVSGNAKDAQRASDLRAISDAIKLYYLDHGQYPASSGSSGINNSWSASTDTSWANLEAQLVPEYMPSLPVDPENTMGSAVIGTSGRGYAYFRGSYCGSQYGQMYILVTRMSGDQKDHFEGDCPTNALYYSGRTNWRASH